ncbi:MAG: hypothetical protein GY758_30860 [Fuerstiella sp.]|nr:hypothetical protein [Fuerstiella sp.]MCP4512253.1 hypothetical protein [Fuerstiella sp.]MDG2130380.1 prepilin-type N-terminal cleavage/methylation domain-containing protein [Fuerstiella sp.]
MNLRLQNQAGHSFNRVPGGPRDIENFASSAHGFTLLEVLLAVGLTTLLMAALYTAMSVYWTTATESYDEIERAQIARAVLRQMARDIQSCTFVEDELSTSDEEEDEADDVDTDTAMATYTNGLFGSDTDLVLYISRPDRNQAYISAQELMLPTDRSSDSMVVRYLMAQEGGGSLGGEFAASNATLVSGPSTGLARMQGDLIGLSTAINQGDMDMQLAATELLAPEVVALRYEYFDGVDYLTEWDSTAQNAMPLAIVIELTLTVVQDENDDRNLAETMGALQDTVHRLVVPIPVSTPYVGETAL